MLKRKIKVYDIDKGRIASVLDGEKPSLDWDSIYFLQHGLVGEKVISKLARYSLKTQETITSDELVFNPFDHFKVKDGYLFFITFNWGSDEPMYISALVRVPFEMKDKKIIFGDEVERIDVANYDDHYFFDRDFVYYSRMIVEDADPEVECEEKKDSLVEAMESSSFTIFADHGGSDSIGRDFYSVKEMAGKNFEPTFLYTFACLTCSYGWSMYMHDNANLFCMNAMRHGAIGGVFSIDVTTGHTSFTDFTDKIFLEGASIGEAFRTSQNADYSDWQQSITDVEVDEEVVSLMGTTEVLLGDPTFKGKNIISHPAKMPGGPII